MYACLGRRRVGTGFRTNNSKHARNARPGKETVSPRPRLMCLRTRDRGFRGCGRPLFRDAAACRSISRAAAMTTYRSLTGAPPAGWAPSPSTSLRMCGSDGPQQRDFLMDGFRIDEPGRGTIARVLRHLLRISSEMLAEAKNRPVIISQRGRGALGGEETRGRMSPLQPPVSMKNQDAGEYRELLTTPLEIGKRRSQIHAWLPSISQDKRMAVGTYDELLPRILITGDGAFGYEI